MNKQQKQTLFAKLEVSFG